MSSVINKKENSVVEISFDVSAEDFGEALKKSFQKSAKKFNIPGFRPGKAPMKIVTKYYGEGALYDEAIEEIASSSYVKAIEEHKLDPVSRPEIGEITEIGSEKGIKFTITVTVKPDVTLGQYKGIEVSKAIVVVTDDQIEAELDKVKERNSRMIPVEDREVLTGDTANIDYEGSLDGVLFDGGKGASYDLAIGSGSFIPGFEEQVIGRPIGEEFSIDVTFPEDYHSEDLKGKSVVFKVVVNSIKVKELPVADDEFAKDVSEFDTLVEYKASLRAKLQDSAEKKAEIEFEDQLLSKVVENATIEVPATMIESELDRMIDEQSQRMSQQGIQIEQYLQYMGQDMDAFRDGLKDSATTRIKTNLVIESIGNAESVDVSEAEVDEEIGKLATKYNMKEEDLKKQFSGDNSYIKQGVIVRKTLDLLKAEAKD